jgi:hypothetical protein
MFDKIPVEGNPGLYRDKFSGAIVNCSDMDFSRYLQLKEQKIVEVNEMKKMKNQVSEIGDIKEEINELKEMMKLIISKLDANL